jgi:hypothetical protein
MKKLIIDMIVLNYKFKNKKTREIITFQCNKYRSLCDVLKTF